MAAKDKSTAVTESAKLYGIYRAVVQNPVDPLRKGRLEVTVPAIEQLATRWAEPCLCVADACAVAAGRFVPPQAQTTVWVMFEGGDPDFPVWIGCEWPSPEMREFWSDERMVQVFGQYR